MLDILSEAQEQFERVREAAEGLRLSRSDGRGGAYAGAWDGWWGVINVMGVAGVRRWHAVAVVK